MDIYSNAIQDERVRCYLPVTRIMTEKIFLGAEALVTPPPEIQLFLWGKTKSECTIQPEGWFLIDFRSELHGGIRLLSREGEKNPPSLRRVRQRSHAGTVSGSCCSRRKTSWPCGTE